MSKIKNRGLDQYCAETFLQQQFRTAGIEGVNRDQHVTTKPNRQLSSLSKRSSDVSPHASDVVTRNLAI